MLVAAHRGASEEAPENTLAALTLGLEQGCPALEFDVRLSSDGVPVLMHDASLFRTTGLNEDVSSLSFEELHALDAGSWKDSAWTGEPVPSLAAVLEAVPPEIRLFIELKQGPESVAPVEDVLSSGARNDEVVIISKNLETVKAYKDACPNRRCLWIVNLPKLLRLGRLQSFATAISTAQEAGLDGLGPKWGSGFTREDFDAAKGAGLYLFCWTLDKVADAQRAADWGVDAIASNRPGAILGQRS